MIDNETIRKASEMGIIDVIDAVNTVESNTTYITLSFDEKIKMIIDMVYQCRYNEAVKKLKKRAKLRYLEADLRDVHYTENRLITEDLVSSLAAISLHRSIAVKIRSNPVFALSTKVSLKFNGVL